MSSAQPRERVVVAIDGPAGAGKSSAAKELARRLGYRLLDTGALYRAVALLARRCGIEWDDAAGTAALARDLDVEFRLEGEQNRVLIAGEDVSTAIRTAEVSEGASHVSAHPEVREALLELQRRLAREGGVVAEGRDVGTVVFPDAAAKFFLTADPAERARRRFEEMSAAGQAADLAATRDDLERRDARDTSRAAAPLVEAPDAVRVDSTDLELDEVVEKMLAAVRAREAAGRI
jgi:CMP/dCMP kinase